MALGASVPLPWDRGLPAAVTGRCPSHMHVVVADGVGLHCSDRSTGSAAGGGWELLPLVTA